MDLSGPGVIYALMIIPSLFVVVVIFQGIQKISRHEPEGGVTIGFGILFLILIVLAYIFYIQ